MVLKAVTRCKFIEYGYRNVILASYAIVHACLEELKFKYFKYILKVKGEYMNRALIIYDNTGKIWSIVYGAQEIPQGLQSMWVDIPQNAVLDRIDMETGEPVFTYLPETELGQLQLEMKQVSDELKEVKEVCSDIPAITQQTSNSFLAATFIAQTFTDEQAIQVKSLYPEWETYIGKAISEVGTKLQYGGLLYKTRQAINIVLENQTPDTVPALYEQIDETHQGTYDDPIPYNNQMELFNGKYYIQDDIIYKCTRDSGTVLTHALKDLVGLYVEVANS